MTDFAPAAAKNTAECQKLAHEKSQLADWRIGKPLGFYEPDESLADPPPKNDTRAEIGCTSICWNNEQRG